MLKPPKGPWIKGQQAEYAAFVIEVTICQNNVKQVFSTHALQDDSDAEIAQSLPSKGMEQAAFGLLTEAIRREVLLQALLKVTQDPKAISRHVLGTIGEKEEIEKEISDGTVQVMQDSIEKMIPQVTKEIMVWMQNPTQENPISA